MSLDLQDHGGKIQTQLCFPILAFHVVMAKVEFLEHLENLNHLNGGSEMRLKTRIVIGPVSDR